MKREPATSQVSAPPFALQSSVFCGFLPLAHEWLDVGSIDLRSFATGRLVQNPSVIVSFTLPDAEIETHAPVHTNWSVTLEFCG